MRTNASGIFLLCTCLCLWWPDNTNRGRPMVGRHPHMSPMLTGLAEYPVVINVLLLSIPRSSLRPAWLCTPWPDTPEPVHGRLRLRPQRSERPARLSLEPTIGPSECQSVGQSHPDKEDIIGHRRDTNSSHHYHPDIRNRGLNVSLSFSNFNA